MKRFLVTSLFFVALLGIAAPSAHALGVYGIWWMPDDSDDDGYGIGIKDKRSFTPLLAVDGRVSYVSFSEPDAGLIPLEMTGMVSLGVWYAGVGAGYYFVTGDNAVKDTFGYYFLAGLELGLGGTSVFGEVKWQALTPEIDIPNGGDVNLDALVIHAGATFGFK